MTKSEAIAAVSREQTRLIQLSDAIWDHPQVKYQETFAAGLLSDFLREEGFTVETGVAGIPTAFCASYGSGAPVIGLLAGVVFDISYGFIDPRIRMGSKK